MNGFSLSILVFSNIRAISVFRNIICDVRPQRNLHSIRKLAVASSSIRSNKTETATVTATATATEFHRRNAAGKKMKN